MNNDLYKLRPSSAFIAATRACLAIGTGAYLIGLWTSAMTLNEKGFYLATLLLGLFAALSVQKAVRDKLEGIRVTSTYVTVCWAALLAAVGLFAFGLVNAAFELSTKGFFGMSFVLSLYTVLVTQKNVRDMELFRDPKSEGHDLPAAFRKGDPL
jgi:uncharacterized membrane protein YiaA